MANIEEQILRATKEIVVKFIESGRISPSGFHETFKSIYSTVEETVKGSDKNVQEEGESESAEKEGKGKGR